MSDEKSDTDRGSALGGRCLAAFVGVHIANFAVFVFMISYGYFVGMPSPLNFGDKPPARGEMGASFAFIYFCVLAIPTSIVGAALGIWYQTRIERYQDKLQSFVLVVVSGVAILVVAWLFLNIEW